MGYDAATTESILLKYLQMRSNIKGSRATSVFDVVSDFGSAESRMRHFQIYGFGQSKICATDQLMSDIADLREFGFIEHDKEAAAVALTEWGFFCASAFDLPASLVSTFEEAIQTRGSRGDEARFPMSRAACVTF